jgi:Ca2+-binding RTX toxin-like protein
MPRVLPLVVLAGLLIAPASASAARVELSEELPGHAPSLLVLDSGQFDGEAQSELNDVTLALAPDGRIEVTDAGAPVQARNGCEAIDEHRARCPAKTIKSISVQLGAGADRYRGLLPGGFHVAVYAGDGNDALIGGAANEILNGGPGAEEIRGGGGFDSYNATFPGPGSDIGVWVTPDGVADDGLPGEGDNVLADVEGLFGTPGPDTIVGSDADNEIVGSGGDDVLLGMGGKDRITGSGTLSGGLGDDFLFASNGRPDAVACGGGQDWVQVDSSDSVAPDCRTPPHVIGQPWSNMPRLAAPFERSRRSRHAPVLVICPFTPRGACRGELTLKRSERVGRRRFRISPGRLALVQVPLTRYGRRLLDRRRSVRLTAQVKTADGRRDLSVVVRTRRR